ncbi:hypothetical protein WJX77_011147 [Trebouxia sp. C0004]
MSRAPRLQAPVERDKQPSHGRPTRSRRPDLSRQEVSGGSSGLQHSMDDEAAVAASADLDFSMPDEMLDYEEAGQIEPAAYDGSPPSRSQQPPQLKADHSRPSSKDAAERKARAKISYEVWKAENEKSGQAVDDKDLENRGSRHESSSHWEHSRRQEASRHDQAAPHRETSRHHESPRRRDGARRRAAAPAHHRPRPARPSPDGRRVTAVPRLLDADRALDRRSRPDRAVHRSPQRTRSPAPGRSLSHRPRSPVPFRQVVLPLERSHSPASHACSVWPELKSQVPQAGPRAPLLHSHTSWEADQFDAEPYRPYPPAAPMDHRQRPDDRYGDYREHDRQHSNYRVPAYREAGYASAGHAAALDRVPDHRQPAYEYGREPYTEFPDTRSVEVGRNGYVRQQPNWDAPRHLEVPPYYAYKDSQQSVDTRWVDAHYEREAPKPERDIPRASASFTRQSSYPEQRYAREEAHLSSRNHAPRLARELVPLARSYRDGQDARVDRDGHPLAPRYADEYVVGRAHSRDPWRSAPPPPPPPAARHASPRDRSPRRRDQADRYREYEVKGGHQDADRPRDRSRRHADRAEPRERAAGNPLAATSKSFAMEAAARDGAPRHADPGHISSSELPPPPSRPTSAAQEKPSEAPKPSRASVLVMPKPEAESHTKREVERDSSPELNVQQGCLQAPAIPRDRPFQRGHAPQQPGETAEKAQAEGRHQSSREVSGAEAMETKQHSDRRDRDQSEPRHAPLKIRGNSPGRVRNPNERRKDSDSRHHDSSHLKAGQASSVKESGMSQSQQKADRSDGKADAAKLIMERPAATADSKDKGFKSDGKVSSRAGAEQARSSPSAKPKADTVRGSKSHERRSARSPTAAATGKGSGRSGSRREVVVAKQAGKKRHSTSPDRGRSPKRRASLPDKHSSDKTHSGKEAACAAAQELPPPPALPGTTLTEGYLPPPPARHDAKRQDQTSGKEGEEISGDMPDGTDLPPPPPKPKSKEKSNGKEVTEQRLDASLSTGQHDTVKAPKPSHSAEGKAAAKPEIHPGSSRRDGRELGKNRAGAAAAAPPPDGHKTADKTSGGRSGRKRSRSRSPEKSRMANGISKNQSKLSDAQRAKSSPDAQNSGAKAGSLRNGKISAAKHLDKDVKKEWIYADKSKQYGPCTMLRLRELKKQLQEDKDPNKVTDFMRCDIWREGDKKNMRLVKDLL